jgi:hypothetical protein
MKIIDLKIQRAALLGSLVLTLLLMLLISGCTSGTGASSSAGGSSSGSASSGGSRTLKQVDMDVSWPITQFRNASGFGKVTSTEQEQVNSAYSRYEAAYREALQAAHNNPDAPAPANVKALADKVIEATHAIPL